MSDATLTLASAPQAPPPAVTGGVGRTWHQGGFGFKDFVDIVNPLQHLPVIGSVYRWATGDEPSDGARIVGDTLYGGPIGLAIGAVSTMTEDAKGRDLGERALAGLFGSDKSTAPAATAVASASARAVPVAAATPALVTALPTRAPASPMMSLFTSAPAPAAATPSATDPQGSFIARTVQFQRQIATGKPPSERSQQLSNHQVPLELSGGQRFGVPPRPPAPIAAPAVLPPGSFAAALPPGSTPMLPAAPPDIAQKMLSALDKYQKLQAQQKTGSTPPGTPITGGTDLSL